MARDLPLIGVTLSSKVQANTAWYKRIFTRKGGVTTTTPAPSSLFTSIGQKTYGFKIRRGRTYELGRLESGECSLSVDNSDSTFDPANGTAVPYRPLTVNAAYPITGNILNDTNLASPVALGAPASTASYRVSVGANDADFELGALSNWYNLNGNTGVGPDISTVKVYAGTYSMAVTRGTNAIAALDIPVVANKPVTVSFYYAWGVAPIVAGGVSIYDGGYADISVTEQTLGSGTTFTRFSYTFIPASPKVTMAIRGDVAGVGTTLYVDNVQVEFGSSVSAFSTSGSKIYGLFNGFVERYPQTYQAPNRGQVNMLATDAIASLSQVRMPALYDSLILGSSSENLYYYPMSEPKDSGGAYNQSLYVQNPLVPTPLSTFGFTYASPVFGVGSAETGIIGGGTTGVDFSCQTSPTTVQGVYLGNGNVNDIVFGIGASYTFSFWVKFQSAGFATDRLLSINAINGTNTATSSFSLRLNGVSKFEVLTGGGTAPTVSASAYSINTWYFVSLNVTRTNSTTYDFGLSINGGTATTGSWSYSEQIDVSNFIIGAPSLFSGTYDETKATTMAHLSIHRGSITASDYYSLGVYGQLSAQVLGEQTGTRFANLMSRLSGFNNLPFSADLGISQMLPVNTTDITVVDYIQTIADTEGGTWYVDGSGYVNFKDRWDRLQKLSPSFTFGDGVGEVAYEGGDLVINYDPTYVLNDVEITRSANPSTRVQDQTSLANYFSRSYARTIYNESDSEASDLAYYLLSRYKDPHARPETIKLTPSRNPAIWATALGLEIGDYVRVNKRPLNGTSISLDCFIERVEHDFDAQSGDWVTVVTLSPQVVSYWNLASMRGTSNGAGVAGLIRIAKGSRSNGEVVNLSDLAINTSLLVQWTDSSSITYVGAIRPSICTDGGTYLVINAQAIATFSPKVNNLTAQYATLSQSITADYVGAVTLATSLAANVNSLIWLNGELIAATGTGTTLTIIDRGQYGTAKKPHVSGEPIYSTSSTGLTNPPNGTVVSEFLSDPNPNANQTTRLPYVAGVYNAYDALSKLGSWYNTLSSDTSTLAIPASSSNSANYNVFTVNALLDKNNYPLSDLGTGQSFTVASTAGNVNFALVAAGVPDPTSGSWALSGYRIIDGSTTLSADLSLTSTTVTTSGTNVPAGTVAIWVDGEFMMVTAGANTSSLTVVRGTPDLLGWNILGISRHYSGDKVWYLTTAGSTATYAVGANVVEGISGTIVFGTTRLGY